MRATLSFQTGFSMVELLLVATLFTLGLLGLAGLQLATLRAGADSSNRLGALVLGNQALDTMLGEARALQSSGSREPPVPTARNANRPDPRWEGACWIEGYDRDGTPAGREPPFYTVTVTRLSRHAEASAALQAHPFQALVTWKEGQGGTQRTLLLARFLTY